MTESSNRHQASRLVLFTTLWLTLFVLSVKVFAGLATGTLSLQAESLHTLINICSLSITLVAIAPAKRIAGRQNYGHGQWETAGTLGLAAVLGFTGFTLLRLSVQKLQAISQMTISQAVSFPIDKLPLLLQLLGILGALLFGITLFLRYQSQRLSQKILRFHARSCLQDAGLTILVLAGLTGVWQSYVWLDPLLAILLVFFAVRRYWWLLNCQLPLLVQQTAIAPEALADIVRQVGGVTHCYQIQSRGIVGRYTMVNLHLVLHPEFMGVADIIAEQVEGAIRERYGPVQARIYIDSEPPASERPLGTPSATDASSREGRLDWNGPW